MIEIISRNRLLVSHWSCQCTCAVGMSVCYWSRAKARSSAVSAPKSTSTGFLF